MQSFNNRNVIDKTTTVIRRIRDFINTYHRSRIYLGGDLNFDDDKLDRQDILTGNPHGTPNTISRLLARRTSHIHRSLPT